MGPVPGDSTPLPPAPGSSGAGLTALGGTTSYRYDHPDAASLETFANPSPTGAWAVSLLCQEFTTLCPVTGQPDYGRLRIDYVPRSLCVESKSLKLYLIGYRNHGTFHEACVNRVADDLYQVLSPALIRVYGDFAPRGGIAIKPVALRAWPGSSPEDRRQHLELLEQALSLSASSHGA